MAQEHTFTAVLEKEGEDPKGGTYIIVPADVISALGQTGQIKVYATIEGHQVRALLAPYSGRHYLGISRKIRETIGKQAGDSVRVTLALDTDPRVTEIPDDLGRALDAAGARGAFEALAYSHRREYLDWIEEAKRPETRDSRIAKTVERVRGSAGIRGEG